MDPGDLVREAAKILDRARLNLVSVLAELGIRLPPAALERMRGVISAAIAEGITLGERYARWRRPHVADPFREIGEDEPTNPGFKSKLPPAPPK